MEKRLGQKIGNLVGLMVCGFLIFLGFYHFSQRFKLQSVGDTCLRLVKETP